MRALRIHAAGVTTSFRYPHFLVGRQPTFRMPPPATIYGHICSALGEFINPAAVRFAYVFRYQGIADDLEQLHVAAVGTGKLPGLDYPRNIEATPNPVRREVLLFPELTLYLRSEFLLDRLAAAFREPQFAVVMGRSQDLMSYQKVEVVELEEAPVAYFEATLLPWSYRTRTLAGVGVTMPRFVDPTDRRRVTWSPFLVLEERIRLADTTDEVAPGRTVLVRTGPEERVWVDPDAPVFRSLKRAVVWHDFVGGEPGGLNFVGAAGAPLG